MRSSDEADVVLVGASLPGLLCAAAAAATGATVVVVDRRGRPTPDSSIAPHGRLPHVLLGGGVVALESLLPGLVGQLLDDGAQPARANSGVWWAGGIRPTWESPHVVPLARRAVIEEAIRRRVEALPRVSIRYGVRATGLAVDGDRIRGIETDDGCVSSELVVEAAGRGSHLDRWLAAAGRVAPEIEQQQIDVSYSSLFVQDPVGRLGSTNWVVIQNQPPEWTRIGLAIRVTPRRGASSWRATTGTCRRRIWMDCARSPGRFPSTTWRQSWTGPTTPPRY